MKHSTSDHLLSIAAEMKTVWVFVSERKENPGHQKFGDDLVAQ